MADVFVVFGSESDRGIYEPLLERLRKTGISYEFRVLSAHKTPRELREALSETNAELFIAGAGLAAALPGVVAAENIKPVIAMPCDGAFQGVDAFLACAQMPPDVPVISVGVGRIEECVSLCSHYLHGFSSIVLVKKKGGEEKKYFAKCKEFLEHSGMPFGVGPIPKKPDFSTVYINFLNLGKAVPKTKATVLTVLVKEKTKKGDAIKFFDSLQGAYCVGLNNYKNAAIAALELVNLRARHSQRLVDLRRKAAEKVIKAARK